MSNSARERLRVFEESVGILEAMEESSAPTYIAHRMFESARLDSFTVNFVQTACDLARVLNWLVLSSAPLEPGDLFKWARLRGIVDGGATGFFETDSLLETNSFQKSG